DSPAESTTSDSIFLISQISQEREEEDAANAASSSAKDSDAPVTNGHASKAESAGTTEMSGKPESEPEPYFFEGTTIKLIGRDYHELERAFTYLDLRAELHGLDGWATREGLGKNWFHAVRGALAKSNSKARLEIERIRAEAAAAAKLKAAPKQHRVI